MFRVELTDKALDKTRVIYRSDSKYLCDCFVESFVLDNLGWDVWEYDTDTLDMVRERNGDRELVTRWER
jgi:hypothetical protein